MYVMLRSKILKIKNLILLLTYLLTLLLMIKQMKLKSEYLVLLS